MLFLFQGEDGFIFATGEDWSFLSNDKDDCIFHILGVDFTEKIL